MSAFILGKKSISTQLFTEGGQKIPVTHIITAPCYLVDIKMPDKHGYCALVLAFQKTKKIAKPQQGQLNKAGITDPLRFLREIRMEAIELIEKDNKQGIKIGEFEIFKGDEIKPTMMFKKDDLVNVTGTSKGKGFAGVVKRYSFKGGPRTHGQSDRERAPGSIGQATTPGRVFKGKRMAGRMGGETITVRSLPVISMTDSELVVKGLVPGARKGLLTIISA